MGCAKWLGTILLLCYSLSSAWSQGELEEAMQWMMMEEVSTHVSHKPEKEKEVEFVLYKKGPARGSPAKADMVGTIHNGALSAKNRLRICVLGWQSDIHSEFAKSFIKLFTFKKKNFQVVVVNWKGAKLDYVGARRLIGHVAETLHRYLLRLKLDLKMDLSKMVIVGHGLGAHIVGAAGQMLEGSVGTIIALDPMGPLFWENTRDVVNASSAKKVIGVHTSSGYLGVYWNVGHVDFWVNRGTAPQPGCYQRDWRRTIVCSHDKSFRYYLEAVNNPQAFHSVECGKKLACNHAVDKKPLGTGFFFEKSTMNGQFCFNTNPTSPYSLADEKSSSEEKPVERVMDLMNHKFLKARKNRRTAIKRSKHERDPFHRRHHHHHHGKHHPKNILGGYLSDKNSDTISHHGKIPRHHKKLNHRTKLVSRRVFRIKRKHDT